MSQPHKARSQPGSTPGRPFAWGALRWQISTQTSPPRFHTLPPLLLPSNHHFAFFLILLVIAERETSFLTHLHISYLFWDHRVLEPTQPKGTWLRRPPAKSGPAALSRWESRSCHPASRTHPSIRRSVAEGPCPSEQGCRQVSQDPSSLLLSKL